MIPIKDIPTEKLVMFFRNQPKETFMYFNPHAFDTKTIMSLQRNRSFLAYVLLDKENDQIAGYCFNRCFFHSIGVSFMDRDSVEGWWISTIVEKDWVLP